MKVQCTILFSDPFWIGIFERWSGSGYEVCRQIFGKEPKMSELYMWLLKNYSDLNFKRVEGEMNVSSKIVNPKKLKKQIAKEVSKDDGPKYAGTKAQQALKSLHEQEKKVHKKETRAQKEAEADEKFRLKQAKKKQKLRGH